MAREITRASAGVELEAVARGRLAIFGKIGLQQIALRFGVALERAQLHVLPVGRCRLVLELIEACGERIDARAGKLGVVLERARDGFRLGSDLIVEVGDLRLQFDDPRMVVEQRRRLLGELRAQGDALLGQPADEFGIEDIGGFDRLAGAQHVADHLGLGLGVGLLRARGGELGIDVAERLRRQRGVVVADQEIGLGAEILDLGFRLFHLLPHGVDFAGEPLRRGLGLVFLGLALPHQIAVGDGVGDLGGKLGILRQEIDVDDARFFDRRHGQPIVIGLEHALFRRHAQRIFDETEQAEHGFDRRYAVERRIEFGLLAELELVDHLAREVARQDDLRLAGHRLVVDRIRGDVLVDIGAQIDVVAAFDEDPRLRLISRRNQLHDDKRDQRDQNRRAQDGPFLAPQCRAERRQIKLGVGRSSARAGGGDATLIPKLLATYLPTDRRAMTDHKLLRLLSG